MCQEKKEIENSPALKIEWINQYKDSMTKLKRTNKDARTIMIKLKSSN